MTRLRRDRQRVFTVFCVVCLLSVPSTASQSAAVADDSVKAPANFKIEQYDVEDQSKLNASFDDSKALRLDALAQKDQRQPAEEAVEVKRDRSSGTVQEGNGNEDEAARLQGRFLSAAETPTTKKDSNLVTSIRKALAGGSLSPEDRARLETVLPQAEALKEEAKKGLVERAENLVTSIREALAGGSLSPEDRARLQAVLPQVEALKKEAKKGFAECAANLVTSIREALASGSLSPEDRARLQAVLSQAEALKEEAKKGFAERAANLVTSIREALAGRSLSPQDRARLQAMLPQIEALKKKAGRFLSAAESPTTKKDLAERAGNLVTSIRKALAGGSLSPEDRARLEALLPQVEAVAADNLPDGVGQKKVADQIVGTSKEKRNQPIEKKTAQEDVTAKKGKPKVDTSTEAEKENPGFFGTLENILSGVGNLVKDGAAKIPDVLSTVGNYANRLVSQGSSEGLPGGLKSGLSGLNGQSRDTGQTGVRDDLGVVPVRAPPPPLSESTRNAADTEDKSNQKSTAKANGRSDGGQDGGSSVGQETNGAAGPGGSENSMTEALKKLGLDDSTVEAMKGLGLDESMMKDLPGLLAEMQKKLPTTTTTTRKTTASKTDTSTVVMASIGGVIGAAAVIGAVSYCFIVRKHKKRDAEKDAKEDEETVCSM